jgi:hypothetical protein
MKTVPNKVTINAPLVYAAWLPDASAVLSKFPVQQMEGNMSTGTNSTKLGVSLLLLMIVALIAVIGRPVYGQVLDNLITQPANTPIVESEHPYQNNTDQIWNINNNTGFNAARIHFSRIELEENVDRIELLDENDKLIQVITTSFPDGIWSDVVPGTIVKVRLVTDSSGRYWGFAVDQLEGVNYTTLGYSPHPYPNNYAHTKLIANGEVNPTGTRLFFDRIELEQDVDYIIIKDINDTPYQWITGNHPNGFTTKAVPGSVIGVQLVSDGSGQAWGYNIQSVATANPDSPDEEPTFPVTLAESDHPYSNNTDETWTIVNPNVNAVSSKVHFSRITLASGDRVQVLDENDTIVQTFGAGTNVTNIWSDHVPGRVVKIRLITDCCGTNWGFRVDNIVDSVPNPGLAQSNHPYSNNTDQTWTIVNPNVNAVSSKVHFSRITLASGDRVQVLDENDTIIQTFSANTNLTNVWSDYVPGRIVKLRLISDCCGTNWGFRVDNIVDSVPNPGLAQSNHPYSNNTNQTWTVVNPNVNAVSSKVHFSRITLASGDRVQVLDENDTIVQTFSANTNVTNVWSDYVPGRIVKIRLISDCCGTNWGFRVDKIFPLSDEPIPPAYISGVYVHVLYPGEIFVNGLKVADALTPGEYKVMLPGTGSYTIRIEYLEHVQEIQVNVTSTGNVQIVYLPLVQRD